MSYRDEEIRLTWDDLERIAEEHHGEWQTIATGWGTNVVMVCSCDHGMSCPVPRLLVALATLMRER